MTRVVVVGAYVMDCIVDTPRLPVWGETYEARSVRTSPGGKALNQAVALARLGAQVTAVGAIGSDSSGRGILDSLRQEGVDTESLQTSESAQTPVCVCLVGEHGRTSFIWHIPKDVAPTSETIQAAAPAIRRADAALITFEIPLPAVRETIKLAHRHGTKVIVQPAPPLRDCDEIAKLPWNQVDVIVPNEAEARELLSDDHNESPVEQDALAEAVANALSAPEVVVTLGDAGCVSWDLDSGSSRHYPAHKAAHVVDTTGASDAFTAHLALHLVNQKPEPDAIHAGLLAAAQTVTHPGGYESMPHAAKVEVSL